MTGIRALAELITDRDGEYPAPWSYRRTKSYVNPYVLLDAVGAQVCDAASEELARLITGAVNAYVNACRRMQEAAPA